MNHYETIFIVDPDTQDTDQESIFEKTKELIANDGTLIMFDDWGTRKLAYEIKKKMQGRYVRLDYCGNGELVDAIERLFRLDYRILKFMTILLDNDVDPETLIIEEEPEPEKTDAETEAAGTDSEADASTPDAETGESDDGEEAQPETETEEEE